MLPLEGGADGAGQAALLLAEGVPLKKNGCVDLKKYQWKC